MNERQPTRAALLEMGDERRALRDGHVFLDEKCLLLAGEMMRQLERHAVLERALLQGHASALAALRDALARHGLEGLQVHAPLARDGASVDVQCSSVMGVPLRQAAWVKARTSPADATVGAPPTEAACAAGEAAGALIASSASSTLNAASSAEVRACVSAHLALLPTARALAATSGNLERLSQEYRRTLRRARALQDVLLPELQRDMAAVEAALEDADQQDALALRRQATLPSNAKASSGSVEGSGMSRQSCPTGQ